MKDSTSAPAPDPGFQVDIHRGGRAVNDAPVEHTPPPREPGRLATPVAAPRRRMRTQQRVLAGVLVVALLVLVGAFALSFYSAAPPGVLARVNGQNITNADVDQEILINRALTALFTGQEQTPSRFSVLESLIDRRMKAQDAARAGIKVTDADVEQFVANLLAQQNKSLADLDTALKGYGLTRADLLAEQHDVVLINTYIGLKVTANATTPDAQQSAINDWVTQLQQTSKVERFGVPDEPVAPRVGATAPDFKLRTMDNQVLGLSDLRGRPVLVNFWATWCEPCRNELPVLESAYKQVTAAAPGPGPGLQILGVAVGSDPNVIDSFQREFGLTYPLLPDDGQIQDLYRVGPIPTSFFIDRQGVIRQVTVGALDGSSLPAGLKLIP